MLINFKTILITAFRHIYFWNNDLLNLASDYLKWYNICISRTCDKAICKFNLHILYGRLCSYTSMIGLDFPGFQKIYD